MAWMNQERKRKIVENVKPILKKYGMKGTFSVSNVTITLTLTSGSLDFVNEMKDFLYGKDVNKNELRSRYNFNVNPYWYDEHYNNGKVKKFLNEVIPAMKSADWYDRSDIQTDYFDTAYYFNINVGKWSAPYTVTK